MNPWLYNEIMIVLVSGSEFIPPSFCLITENLDGQWRLRRFKSLSIDWRKSRVTGTMNETLLKSETDPDL